jgi:hypothetical protein
MLSSFCRRKILKYREIHIYDYRKISRKKDKILSGYVNAEILDAFKFYTLYLSSYFR